MVLLCALLATGVVANAQDPIAVSLSQAEAVREFPELVQQGSNFNKRFVERFNSLKIARDSLLLRDDWPEVLAREIGVELDVAPLLPPTSIASTSPTPASTPWTPLGTMLDQKPGAETATDSQQTSGGTLLDERPGDRYHIIGTVLQKVTEGLLVSCDDPTGKIGKFAKNIVLLKDAPMYENAADGDPVKCWGTVSGNFSYDDVSGGGSTVHAYEYSQ